MKRKPIPMLSVLILAALFFGSGCSNPPTPAASAALFDHFTYEGEDDFYKDNNLPGEEYFYNPILPGWYSDPSICSNGEDYFLATSTFSYFPGVPIFHSRDLVNWIQIGHILDRSSQLPLKGQQISEGIFAPAIRYNPHNQTYYMITTNIRHGNFFVKTQNPFSEWSEPVWLPEVQGIDPSFFFDDDGRAYIVNNDVPDGGSLYDGHRAIRIQEFDVEKEMTFGPRKMIVNGGVNPEKKPIWIEGPHLYKISGKYLLMCAEGGTSVNHREVIFSGDAPMGDFTPWERNPILTQKHLDPERPLPVTCSGHADLIQAREGDWWAVFLACRPIANQFENLGRETFMVPVRWSEDGFPYMLRGEEAVPRILQRIGVQRAPDPTFGNFTRTDAFDSGKLSMAWLRLRGPAEDLYSLTDHPGYLLLKCADVASNELGIPALVTRRIQHHKFTCSTTMTFDPMDEHEAAGLLLLKDETHQYFLCVRRTDSTKMISLEKVSESGSETIAAEEIAEKTTSIPLKILSEGRTFDFYFAEKEGQWKLLAGGVDASYLSTANSFGFTGTTLGMYATRRPFSAYHELP
jgi:xylan 1,4-beta-xylosidase